MKVRLSTLRALLEAEGAPRELEMAHEATRQRALAAARVGATSWAC
jgi:hypothetical protein